MVFKELLWAGVDLICPAQDTKPVASVSVHGS